MLTTRAHVQPHRRRLAGAILAVLTLAACGSAAAPSQTTGLSTAPSTPRPTPTAVPGDGGTGGGIGVDPGTGGGAGGGWISTAPRRHLPLRLT
jgi:hypothetical protein